MGATNVPPIDPALPFIDPASGLLTAYGERVLRGLVGRTGGAVDKVEQTHVIASAAAPKSTIVAASGGLQFGGALDANVGLTLYRGVTAVSLLPMAGNAEGDWAYAIDAPKVFETPGAGTGAPCWWSQGAWQSLGGGTSTGPAIGSGTVTTTGAPASGALAKFSGATSITSGDLSGDVTTSGALTTTIGANKVTYAKFQQIAAASLFGNPTGSLANGQAITLGTGLSFSGSTLNATSSVTFASPTASVSGTAANGTATTAMRSDAAPALANTAITPGTYGDATNSARVTFDAQGRAISVTNVPITGAGGGTIFPGYAGTTPPPALASFSWVNQNGGASGTTAVQAGGAGTPILMTMPNYTGSNQWRGLFLNQASTPYTQTAWFQTIQPSGNNALLGLYFYDGAKLMGIELLIQTGGAVTIRVVKLGSVTGSTNTQVATTPAGYGIGSPLGLRLTNNGPGSTLAFSFSMDGYNPVELYSENIGTFITPTQNGWGGLNNGSSGQAGTQYINLQSWGP